jgi:hypothetical protein
LIHIALHFLVPLAVAVTWYRKRWFSAFAMLIGTMLIDLDHLLADPIYNPERCSIGFHPGHTWPAITVYLLALGWSCWKKRYADSVSKSGASHHEEVVFMISLGLLIHMVLDGLDCLG